jgi:hypothetical protein
MKKSTVAFIVVLLALGAFFAMDARKEGFSLFRLFSEDKKTIERMTLSFMEDIQFKDFDRAASYHHPDDRQKHDIPKLIERLFQIKPELLDIMEYKILESDLDSSGNRGRVKVKTKVHRLNTDDFRDAELMFYYHKKDGNWHMELESSLRKL